MHILVVDDDQAVRDSLKRSLQYSGYEVASANDGIEALAHLSSHKVDAVIMDVMMPRLDGLSAVERLRADGISTPVIFLTARDSLEDKLAGFKAGGDDYLVKPFAFSELVARIQVLLRRTHGARDTSEPTLLGIADLELDLVRRKATRAGQRVDLTAKEFLLLTLFLRRKGEVLSRTEIAEQVWDMNFDSDTSVVETAIRRLRSKMDSPFEKTLLHTVRGMGYILEERN